MEEREAAAKAQLESELGSNLAGQFIGIIETGTADRAAFRAAAFEYFDGCVAKGDNPDPYFNWVGQLALPRAETPLAMTGLWEWAMAIAHEWEDERGRHQHKGSGYYFAGMRDASLGDLDRAFLYVHQAAVEDAWPDRDRIPSSPAGWLITMDDRSDQQSAYDLVKRWADFVRDRLEEYRDAGRGALDIEGLRARYATHPKLGEAMPAIAHAVARIVRLAPSRGLRIHENRYSALLLTQVELELGLILEDVLTDAPGIADPGWTLSKLVSQYPAGHGVDLGSSGIDRILKLANINGNVLDEMLGGTTLTGFERELTPRESDLVVAILIRNTSAHGLDRPGDVALLFEDVVRRLFFALFAAIESLYAHE